MAQAYEHLSQWFERLNDDCGYEQWSQYFLSGLAALGAGSRGLEVGCGSGAFTRVLTKAGYVMTGADLSVPMLSEAMRRAREEGLSIRYVQADAAKLNLGDKFDFLLSPNDCYNYISQEKLLAVFRHAAAALRKGGLFWFDLSSSYKLREKIADNIFADDRDDVTYLCFTHLFSDRVEMDVTLFVRRTDSAFERFDEQHVQYIHETQDVVGKLEQAGFTVLRVEGHLGEEVANSDRVNFICRKA